MIVIGGYFPNNTICDNPPTYGMHGLSFGKENSKNAKWAAPNLNLTTYRVPDEIATTIGGGPTGAATLTAPTGGFQARDLSVAFTRAYTPPTRTPTRAIPTATSTLSPSNHKNRKAVIGGAVGGTLGGLALIAALGACFIIYRRKKADMAKNTLPTDEGTRRESHDRHISELPSGEAADGLGLKSPTVQTQQSLYGSPPPPAWTPSDVYATHQTPVDKTVHNYQYPYPQELAAPTHMAELPALAPEAQEISVPSSDDSKVRPAQPDS